VSSLANVCVGNRTSQLSPLDAFSDLLSYSQYMAACPRSRMPKGSGGFICPREPPREGRLGGGVALAPVRRAAITRTDPICWSVDSLIRGLDLLHLAVSRLFGTERYSKIGS